MASTIASKQTSGSLYCNFSSHIFGTAEAPISDVVLFAKTVNIRNAFGIFVATYAAGT
jgi:hypothetical protein